MTYEELRQRCCRIMGLSPDANENVRDCLRFLRHHGTSRGIAAENLARELAEYVESSARRPETARTVDLMAELKKKLPQGVPVAWRWRRAAGANRHWAYADDPPRGIGVGECEVEPLYAAAAAPEAVLIWKHVSDVTQRQVAWIDPDARYVAVVYKGREYLLDLPPLFQSGSPPETDCAIHGRLASKDGRCPKC